MGATWGCGRATSVTEERAQLTASQHYIAFVERACDLVESDMAEITRVAEMAAARHIAGGMPGFAWNQQGMQDELWGRSGGLMHMGFNRPFERDRTEAERQLDVVLINWQRDVFTENLGTLKDMKARGVHIIGFGPKAMPKLADYVAVCDTWFDTGFGADDRVVMMPDGSRAGRGNLLVSMLHGWAFTAEYISALTRRGKIPPIWQAYLYDEGIAWGDKYSGKMQFHDDLEVPPVEPGVLAGRFLDRIRALSRKLDREQMESIRTAADLVAAEKRAGRKTVCAAMGHAPWTYVAQYEDQAWVEVSHFHSNISSQVDSHVRGTADGALVLHLGYFGTDSKAIEVFESKQQRVMYISADTPRDGEVGQFTGFVNKSVPDDAPAYINMGMRYGDACVELEGYPHRILPPSGIMQLVAYECVNVEVLSRLLVETVEPGTE
ncbi:MAG: hypothetical protein CMJ49_01595 [Planctomycetaceae bacterium]|nr:hypothetical protein [Planctomycetaceae bacterium]